MKKYRHIALIIALFVLVFAACDNLLGGNDGAVQTPDPGDPHVPPEPPTIDDVKVTASADTVAPGSFLTFIAAVREETTLPRPSLGQLTGKQKPQQPLIKTPAS
jgi:hypothetical protein